MARTPGLKQVGLQQAAVVGFFCAFFSWKPARTSEAGIARNPFCLRANNGKIISSDTVDMRRRKGVCSKEP
jgi:hypothetical protein